jgi:hypothetical protein
VRTLRRYVARSAYILIFAWPLALLADGPRIIDSREWETAGQAIRRVKILELSSAIHRRIRLEENFVIDPVTAKPWLKSRIESAADSVVIKLRSDQPQAFPSLLAACLPLKIEFRRIGNQGLWFTVHFDGTRADSQELILERLRRTSEWVEIATPDHLFHIL